MSGGGGTPTQQVSDVLERYFVSLRKDEGYVVDGVDSDELARLVIDALQLTEERVPMVPPRSLRHPSRLVGPWVEGSTEQ